MLELGRIKFGNSRTRYSQEHHFADTLKGQIMKAQQEDKGMKDRVNKGEVPCLTQDEQKNTLKTE